MGKSKITDTTKTIAADAPAMLARAMIAGSSAGIIEAQESRGQRELVNSSQLPRDGLFGMYRAKWEAVGIKILGEDTPGGDVLFVDVELPAGWTKRRTDHAMWSDLVDDMGRKRAGIFYKAAFYDRSARISAERRFAIDMYHSKADDKFQAAVTDCDRVVFTSQVHDKKPWGDPAGRRHNEEAESAIENECDRWLVDHGYPDHRDPFAYWDVP